MSKEQYIRATLLKYGAYMTLTDVRNETERKSIKPENKLFVGIPYVTRGITKRYDTAEMAAAIWEDREERNERKLNTGRCRKCRYAGAWFNWYTVCEYALITGRTRTGLLRKGVIKSLDPEKCELFERANGRRRGMPGDPFLFGRNFDE